MELGPYNGQRLTVNVISNVSGKRTETDKMRTYNTKNVDVVKKADRTLYDVQYIAAEPNRRKYRVWNSHGQVTTLPMAFPRRKFRRFGLCCVLWVWLNDYILQQL